MTPAPGRLAEALLYGSLGVLAFSVSLPANRIAILGGFDGAFVGAGRAAAAGLLSVAILAARRARLPEPRVLARLGVVALGVGVGFPLFSSLALAQVPASHGVIVVGLLPIATAAVATLRNRERPSGAFWSASCAGLTCVLAFAATRDVGTPGRADLLLLLAVAACAVGYAEGGQLAKSMGGERVICWALVLALPLTLTMSLLTMRATGVPAASGGAWLGFAYLCLVSNFLGFLAWYRGLALGGVARIGQLQLAQPVLSLAWSAILARETITAGTAATSLAILACVAAIQILR